MLRSFESAEEVIHHFGLSSLTHPAQGPSLDQSGQSNSLSLLVSSIELRAGQARNVSAKLSDIHKKRLQGARAALDGFSRTYPTRPPDSEATSREASILSLLLSTVDTQQDSDASLSE